jgi:hypothetical protein
LRRSHLELERAAPLTSGREAVTRCSPRGTRNDPRAPSSLWRPVLGSVRMKSSRPSARAGDLIPKSNAAAAKAAALDAGFRSGGWPSTLRKEIEVSLALRKTKAGYVSGKDSSDPKVHTAKIRHALKDLIDHLRRDIERVAELKAQALFETSAEVLQGLTVRTKEGVRRATCRPECRGRRAVRHDSGHRAGYDAKSM